MNHPKLGAVILIVFDFQAMHSYIPATTFATSTDLVRLPHLFSTSQRCPLLFLFAGHVSDLLKLHETTKPHQGFVTLGSFAHLVAKA